MEMVKLKLLPAKEMLRIILSHMEPQMYLIYQYSRVLIYHVCRSIDSVSSSFQDRAAAEIVAFCCGIPENTVALDN
jgi:uncharacterized membrane protein